MSQIESDRVGQMIAETPVFRVYLYTLPDGSVGFLKVATEKEHNGLLDREAFILRLMAEESASLETEFAQRQAGQSKPKTLNYQICFPRVVDSFICPDQGDRQVLILSASEAAKDLSLLVPLGHIRSKDRVRVDPKTSAWILGKFLKLLAFTHSIGISNRRLDGENLLINRNEHMVFVFDWSDATKQGDRVEEDTALTEISAVAQEVTLLLGGDPITGELPSDPQIDENIYAEFVRDLVLRKQGQAKDAHAAFYKLIYVLWPRGFHPFTAYPL